MEKLKEQSTPGVLVNCCVLVSACSFLKFVIKDHK